MPHTIQQARLSEAVFYNMTGGAASMTQENVIDVYYEGLTGTWASLGGIYGEMPEKTTSDGPYPTS
ncbi:uncharacterized protein EDB93DRAFT_1251343 [Suillus bovinus]|uniref:uncharacterized protein n=1 Tax=Suillus bovinus TaxID=48563 RepID=UPI001B8607FE|nr:uncharacterized protein EDB93DRAFT_1251343 [Suillus bovinus]KAG2145473.1 hypothetical protein EDB93DRAFT_1251343 [Suillus bovinus]